MRLYFDIETSPAPGSPKDYIKEVQPPKSYKKQESIDAWLAANSLGAAEQLHRKTSLNPEAGSILCIACAVDEDQAQVESVKKPFEDLSEAQVLVDFFNLIDELDQPVFIGHNIKGFDIPFIIKRAMILGVVPPPRFLDAWSKRYSDAVYDTMEKWAGYNKFISQTKLAEVLKIPHKDLMAGADVYDHIFSDKVSDVVDYCAGDVTLVRNIFRRMNWLSKS